MPIARTNTDALHHVPGEVAPAARVRDAVILRALAGRRLTLAQLERETGLSSAVLLADLRGLGDEGRVVSEPLYSLPERK